MSYTGVPPMGIVLRPGASIDVELKGGNDSVIENLAEIAENVTVLPSDELQDGRYFKTEVLINESGKAIFMTKLDTEALDFARTSDELINNVRNSLSGSDVTITLTSAKKGFWYGVKSSSCVNELASRSDMDAVSQATHDGVTLTLRKPKGSAAFFKIIVSDQEIPINGLH
jgi:hypothetical protein